MRHFIDQFYKIIHDPEIVRRVSRLLKLGEKDKLFLDYFGVNFNLTDLVSVKLYFSFFKDPSEELLDCFDFEHDIRTIIREHWLPSTSFSYLHQGLTFGLKCYLKNDKIHLHDYLHFRSKSIRFDLPSQLRPIAEDLGNFQGICIEKHRSGDEFKKYFYISSEENKHILLEQFNRFYCIGTKDVSLIEYTESSIEKKVNLIIPKAEHVTQVLKHSASPHLFSLCEHFHKEHQLYYYGPGFRQNSDVQAIYFLPKALYYGLQKVNILQQLYSVKTG